MTRDIIMSTMVAMGWNDHGHRAVVERWIRDHGYVGAFDRLKAAQAKEVTKQCEPGH